MAIGTTRIDRKHWDTLSYPFPVACGCWCIVKRRVAPKGACQPLGTICSNKAQHQAGIYSYAGSFSLLSFDCIVLALFRSLGPASSMLGRFAEPHSFACKEAPPTSISTLPSTSDILACSFRSLWYLGATVYHQTRKLRLRWVIVVQQLNAHLRLKPAKFFNDSLSAPIAFVKAVCRSSGTKTTILHGI